MQLPAQQSGCMVRLAYFQSCQGLMITGLAPLHDDFWRPSIHILPLGFISQLRWYPMEFIFWLCHTGHLWTWSPSERIERSKRPRNLLKCSFPAILEAGTRDLASFLEVLKRPKPWICGFSHFRRLLSSSLRKELILTNSYFSNGLKPPDRQS